MRTCAVSWCIAGCASGLNVCAIHRGHHFIPDDLSTAQKTNCPDCDGYGDHYRTAKICATCSGTGQVLDVQHALRRAE